MRCDGFFNPYFQLAVGAILVTASELLLKKGAETAPALGRVPEWVGIAALASGWTWCGIMTYILSFGSWLIVLKRLPLGVAFSLISVVHVLVPLAAWLVLGEHISSQRWMGIGLVVAGIVIIAQPATRAEENL
jgi:multidrug transporter EmrE-like cation transporter